MITHQEIARFVYETGSPFKRLEALLAPVRPNPNLTPITMTVGEPRHDPPSGVLQALSAAQAGFAKYPASNGTPDHRRAIADWLIRRYDLPRDRLDTDAHILPLNGSREGLVLAARTARDMRHDVERPVIIMQNPFYQAYAAGALMADCDVVLLDETDTRGQGISDEVWQRTVAAYIASPTNPQGQILSHSDWHAWIELARLHGFYLFADECYSEIYRRDAPPGVLEVAARSAGGFRHVVSFNSLSKRSNLPGLRTGFTAGDEAFMAAFMRLRTMGGPQVPIPLQAAASLAWGDENHVMASRALYAKKWALVENALNGHLSEPTPDAGFFLWLKLPAGLSDVEAALELWENQALRTIPGSYLAYPTTPTTCQDRLRLALVDDEPTTAQALTRLATLFA
ncbi:MAG: aminotransferase class I/II-fold pyridoxal phosphate-dependent enzyme [Hyphomicrobiales bacterium]|jgi:N-succinyldiaminopimelate aminotransferase